jgi:Cu-processing system ATP-binding protein
MITIQNIQKRFGKQHVLKGIDVELKEGQTIALMGPNGSGKTTLIKSILGMVRPDAGKIIFQGHDVANSWKYREKIGYMPQMAQFPDRIKVKELFNMLKDIRLNTHKGIVDEELIKEYELESIFEKRVGTLSGGTRQKVSAAIAFMFDPSMLILDEPTTGLDPVSSEILKRKIIRERSKQKLIFITSHIMSDVEEVSSHVMYLFEGKLRFVKTLGDLKSETGEASLNKAIVKIMVNENQQRS